MKAPGLHLLAPLALLFVPGQAKRGSRPEASHIQKRVMLSTQPVRKVPAAAAASAATPSSAYTAAVDRKQGTIEDIEMTFELANYHYDDLEREAFIPVRVDANASVSLGEQVAEMVTKVLDNTISEGLAANPVRPLGSPSVPRPGPVASAPVNVFVSFRAGKLVRPAKASFREPGTAARSTLVDVVITNKPNTGGNRLREIEGLVKKCQASGKLMRHFKAALFQATGIAPKLFGVSSQLVTGGLKQWDDDACETHMEKVVHMLELAYTRRMVPVALFNECTNLIPSLSFSHDAIANPLDRRKCRIATIKFTQRWQYGKADWKYGTDTEPGHDSIDYSDFCHDVCETRFGGGSPQCNATAHGEKP